APTHPSPHTNTHIQHTSPHIKHKHTHHHTQTHTHPTHITTYNAQTHTHSRSVSRGKGGCGTLIILWLSQPCSTSGNPMKSLMHMMIKCNSNTNCVVGEP